MPIYAYRCAACGHAKDVLQKLSDAPLTDCPACGAARFEKQVTAAGFQLKGSGWYVTDFRNGSSTKPESKPETKPDAQPETTTNAPAAAPTAAAPATPGAPAAEAKSTTAAAAPPAAGPT
jgi:putative FmdB family regulatory protein